MKSHHAAELPPVLTIAELRAVLRVSKSTALAMVREGQVRAIRHGRVIRIPRGAVLELLGEVPR